MAVSIKKKIQALSRTVRGDIRALEGTGLFQPEWYLRTYPEAARSGMSPIEHFVRVGEKKGYNPNPYFDQKWYLKQVKAARRFPGPAAVHYATKGWKNGRRPSPRFSLSLYLKHNPEVAGAGEEPLSDFLNGGYRKGRIAIPAWLESDEHEKLTDEMNIIAKSGLFMRDWYKSTHTDLWHDSIDPLLHFVRRGARENRQPNPVFDTVWYKNAYKDDIEDANPLAFYASKGAEMGHWPARDFSPALYLEENDDIDPEKVDPLGHYLHYGLREKRRYPRPGTQVLKQGIVDKRATLPLAESLRGMVEFEKTDLTPKDKTFNSSAMEIHWVVPDFSPGAGGHMTIFRMAHYLELFGHKQTIWINNPSFHASPDSAYDTICKHFQHFAGEVKFIDDSFQAASGDAIIATDCWTVWPVLSASNFKRRFYFVQDFEPSFHPMGSSYLAAEATYKEDLDCICAGPWLENLMRDEYGKWARHFWLAADRNLYLPSSKPRQNKVPRIAFYARHFTARRAVELAMLALEELARRDVAFEVDFFGAPLHFKAAPFPFLDHGVAAPEELAHLFQQADVGIVFSATNYSLVPQEMMACELPIVELKGENTTCIFPEDTVTLAEPNPVAIADGLEKLLTDPALREKQAGAAAKWVSQFSWPDSAHLVESALKERLAEFAQDTAGVSEPKVEEQPLKASVVIPTLNAGPVLDRVLAAVTSQTTKWPYEVLVIDSGSTDGTLETVARYPSIRLHQIDKKDFDHGDTRNLGVELTSGEFIAFLTHDALPANDRWLHNLVTSIEHYPEAAGAFGKHLAWPEASAFTKRDLNAHFDMLAAQPLLLTRDTDKKRYDNNDPQWHQLLHFYSDNNSCMRRSVWEKIPYRRTRFGEDQLWADDIIREGYGKVYAVRAVVYHSHDYDAAETRERNMTESAFFKHFFGYKLVKNQKKLKEAIEGSNDHDKRWGKNNDIPQEEIDLRCELNEARLTGYLDGVEADTSEMFEDKK
jgi:glycosyltransferase involved in cell wall biosynthesis